MDTVLIGHTEVGIERAAVGVLLHVRGIPRPTGLAAHYLTQDEGEHFVRVQLAISMAPGDHGSIGLVQTGDEENEGACAFLRTALAHTQGS